MSIKFACACGRSFTVADHLAGKWTRCSSCQTKIQVPAAPAAVADGGWEVVESPTAAPPPPLAAPAGPISFACGCGQPLEVEAEYAGQEVECPTCQKVVRAPSPRPAVAKRASRPAAAAVVEDDEPAPKRRRFQDSAAGRDEKSSATDKYMRDARRRMRDEEERESRNRGGGMSGQAVGSLVAAIFFAVLAVVMFLLTGRLPIIWIILCVLNLVWFTKSLAGGD